MYTESHPIKPSEAVKQLAHCAAERFETVLPNALTASSEVSNFVPLNFSFTVGKRKKSHGAISGECGGWITNWMEFCVKKSIV